MSEINIYDRDYKVFITRPQQIRDIFYDNRGIVRSIEDEIRDITLEGINALLPRPSLNFDLTQGIEQASIPVVDRDVKFGISNLLPQPSLDFDYSTLYDGSTVRRTVQTVVEVSEQTLVFEPPLHMEADIQYETAQTYGGKGKCTLRLFNLNKNAVENIKHGYIVTLFAGYKSSKDLFLCFVGKIATVKTSFDGSGNTVTEIISSETIGVKEESTTQACFKFAAGATVGEVFDKFVDTFKLLGYPEGNFERNANTRRTLAEPYIVNAPLADALSQLCAAVNYTWLISLGKLYILPRYSPRPIQVIQVTPATIISIDSSDTESTLPASGKDIDAAKGIKLTTYFTSFIRPENYIQISEGDYIGTYRPVKVSFTLSWHGGDWLTVTECERVEKFESTQYQSF